MRLQVHIRYVPILLAGLGPAVAQSAPFPVGASPAPVPVAAIARGPGCLVDRGLHQAWRLERDAQHPERPGRAIPADPESCPLPAPVQAALPAKASLQFRTGASVRVVWLRGPSHRMEFTGVVERGGNAGEAIDVRLPGSRQVVRGSGRASGEVMVTAPVERKP